MSPYGITRPQWVMVWIKYKQRASYRQNIDENKWFHDSITYHPLNESLKKVCMSKGACRWLVSTLVKLTCRKYEAAILATAHMALHRIWVLTGWLCSTRRRHCPAVRSSWKCMGRSSEPWGNCDDEVFLLQRYYHMSFMASQITAYSTAYSTFAHAG